MTRRAGSLRSIAWPLRSARVAWRPPSFWDVPELVRHVSDPRISDPTTIPHPYSAAQGRAFVRMTRAKLRAGEGVDLLGFDLADGRLLGSVGLTLRAADRPGSYAEVGYWIAVEEWGKGYAGEGLELALDLGFGRLRLRRIEAYVKGYNAASLRVLRRAGFRVEGRARASVLHRGRWYDRVLVGLLREEYLARRKRGSPTPARRR